MINPDIRQIGIVVGFRPNNKNLEEKYYVGLRKWSNVDSAKMRLLRHKIAIYAETTSNEFIKWERLEGCMPWQRACPLTALHP